MFRLTTLSMWILPIFLPFHSYPMAIENGIVAEELQCVFCLPFPLPNLLDGVNTKTLLLSCHTRGVCESDYTPTRVDSLRPLEGIQGKRDTI